MTSRTILQSYTIGNRQVKIFVPDADELKEAYQTSGVAATSFYWAKVWPAAIGLCNFLQDNLQYINNKNVLELAAGPGLPGIFAASNAASVCISDIEPQAVALVQQSVAHHQLKNISCRVIDWNNLDDISIPEIVLLSDINYEPTQFETLAFAINLLLSKQCTIILSTPQRLMAKEFISKLLPHCIEQIAMEVEMNNTRTGVSVFVLKT